MSEGLRRHAGHILVAAPDLGSLTVRPAKLGRRAM